MIKVRYIFRNINILNAILSIAFVIMGLYVLLPQFRVDLKYILPPQKKSPDTNETVPAAHIFHSLSDYLVIAEDNLFHPERQMPPEKIAEEKPLPKPEFVVYGTIISEDVSVAFLEDLKAPVSTTGRGKRQIRVIEGDVFGGFALKEVHADKIVMVRGEEVVTVRVRKDRSVKDIQPSADKTAAAVKPAASVPIQPPLPGRRAPMTEADERVRAFFTR